MSVKREGWGGNAGRAGRSGERGPHWAGRSGRRGAGPTRPALGRVRGGCRANVGQVVTGTGSARSTCPLRRGGCENASEDMAARSGERGSRTKIARVNGHLSHGSTTSEKRQVKARTKMPLVNDSFTTAISVRRFRSLLAIWNVSGPLSCSRDGTAGARHRPALRAPRPNRSFARRSFTPRPHTFTRRRSANQLPGPRPQTGHTPAGRPATIRRHPPLPARSNPHAEHRHNAGRIGPDPGQPAVRSWSQPHNSREKRLTGAS